jgi:hypothetical protein
LHIWDHTIKPILLYGCEIWGIFPIGPRQSNKSLIEILKNLPADNLDIKSCKFILGVHKKASNIAVRGELGRYPLYIDTLLHIVTFWKRLTKMEENSLLHKAYACEQQLTSEGTHTWLKCVKHILNKCNMLHIYNRPKSFKDRFVTKALIKNLRLEYKNTWRSLIKGKDNLTDQQPPKGNKLRTYLKIKDQFHRESYLQNITNKDHRHTMTRFRISAHVLNIEYGRYRGIKVNERVCPYCPTKVEDEMHFLLSCQKYAKLREQLLQKLPSYPHTLETEKLFIWLMANNDPNISKEVSTYLYQCFCIRQISKANTKSKTQPCQQ